MTDYAYNSTVNCITSLRPIKTATRVTFIKSMYLIPLPLETRPSEPAKFLTKYLNDLHVEICL